MLKIRDLGISVIPATMRPPEVGMGGGFDLAVPCGTSGQQHPPPCKAPSRPPCPAKSKPPKKKAMEAGGLAPEAIAALRQQLQMELE